MNNKIHTLDLSKVMALDIETVRGEMTFDENHPFYDVWAWKQRAKDDASIPPSEEVIKSYYDKAGLFAEWGRIVCISVGYIHNGKIMVKSFTGDEKDILRKAVETIKQSGRMLAGHNLINFDLPYMRKRYFINGLDTYLTEKQGNDVYVKPWDLDSCIFDTMVAWKGSGYLPTSLEELAMCFNIPTPKGDMHGNQVSEYYYSGRLAEIANYCEGDVATVLNILLRWQGKEILERESRTEIEQEKRDLLQELYVTKDFGKNFQDRLKKQLKDRKMTPAEKVVAERLTKAAYLEKVPLMGMDKKAIEEENDRRTKDVEDFFKKIK